MKLYETPLTELLLLHANYTNYGSRERHAWGLLTEEEFHQLQIVLKARIKSINFTL